MTHQEMVIGTIAPGLNLTLRDQVGDLLRLRLWESFFRANTSYGAPCATKGQTITRDITVTITSRGLTVALDDRPDFEPFGFDFIHPGLLNRLRTTGRSNPLVKALGSGKALLRIFDATLGQCFDSLIFAKMGHLVVGVERNPVIYALAKDAWSRVLDDKILHGILDISRIDLLYGDSAQILRALPKDQIPHIIYLDPMFPEETTRTALPRKEIQIFRALAGDDGDAEELLELALRIAHDRVIVKRPSHAPPLIEKVTHSIESKLVRYDMYLTNSGVHL